MLSRWRCIRRLLRKVSLDRKVACGSGGVVGDGKRAMHHHHPLPPPRRMWEMVYKVASFCLATWVNTGLQMILPPNSFPRETLISIMHPTRTLHSPLHGWTTVLKTIPSVEAPKSRTFQPGWWMLGLKRTATAYGFTSRVAVRKRASI